MQIEVQVADGVYVNMLRSESMEANEGLLAILHREIMTMGMEKSKDKKPYLWIDGRLCVLHCPLSRTHIRSNPH